MKRLFFSLAKFQIIAFLMIAGIALSSCEREEMTPFTSAQIDESYLDNPMARSDKGTINILPNRIWEFVDRYYPGETIETAVFVVNELEQMKYYLVTLSNSVQLKFTLQGIWVKKVNSPVIFDPNPVGMHGEPGMD